MKWNAHSHMSAINSAITPWRTSSSPVPNVAGRSTSTPQPEMRVGDIVSPHAAVQVRSGSNQNQSWRTTSTCRREPNSTSASSQQIDPELCHQCHLPGARVCPSTPYARTPGLRHFFAALTMGASTKTNSFTQSDYSCPPALPPSPQN